MVRSSLSFMDMESEIGALLRSTNWSGTDLGDPVMWPDSLKSKLNTIIHSAFPMFLFWGNDNICFYNDAFRPILGSNGKHPAIGQKGSYVWEEVWDMIGPVIADVKATGRSAWGEDKLLRFYRNGRIEDVYWTASYSPVTDAEGNIEGVVIVCMETTEKVNLFRQLQESRNLYEFAIDASEIGTWDLDPVTNKFIANSRLKEWFGLGAEEHIDLNTALNSVAEKDRSRVSSAISAALDPSSGGAYDIEYSIVNSKTGQERIVRAKGKATFGDDNVVCRFNGTLQDITAEVLAHEQNRKLSILVENSVDLMAILRMDGKNSYINSAGKELLGISPDADVTTIPITDFHTPEQFEFVASEILPNVMTKGKWSGQFGIKNSKTGEIIPLYNNCHRIDDERTGEPIGVGTVMRDIRTELNARQNLEEEVKRRTRELEKLNEELERKNKDLASFAFVSSHDLQEPLRKINTFISRIEEDGAATLPPNYVRYFDKIKSSSVRMQTLINDLLTFSRTNTLDQTFEPVDINVLLGEIKKDFTDALARINGTITYSQLPQLHAVPFQLSQLFTNLFGNSIKFARKDVPLAINLTTAEIFMPAANTGEAPRQYHHIAITDNGIGFEPQYAAKIFEVFQRLHSKDTYEGTGIGLSICKRIMENHNGTITAEGIPGKGATFNLYFPFSNSSINLRNSNGAGSPGAN